MLSARNDKARLHGGRVVDVDLLGTGGFLGIHEIAQFFGWLEVRHPLCRDVDFGARLRIAADAWLSLTCTEGSEAANLNLVAGFEGADHGVKEGIDDDFAVAAGQGSPSGDFFNEGGLCHRYPFRAFLY